MSCYQVSDETLHVILGAMLYGMAQGRANVHPIGFDRFCYWNRDDDARDELCDERDATRIGKMLARWNAESVGNRYREQPIESDWYVFKCPRFLPTPGEVAKAVACYRYQACEAKDWEGSPADRFVEGVNARLLRTLPGFDAAPWGWTADEMVARCKGVAAAL